MAVVCEGHPPVDLCGCAPLLFRWTWFPTHSPYLVTGPVVTFMITAKCTHSLKDQASSSMFVLFCLGIPFTLLKLVLCLHLRQLLNYSGRLAPFSVLNPLPQLLVTCCGYCLAHLCRSPSEITPLTFLGRFNFSSLRKILFPQFGILKPKLVASFCV